MFNIRKHWPRLTWKQNEIMSRGVPVFAVLYGREHIYGLLMDLREVKAWKREAKGERMARFLANGGIVRRCK